MAMPAAGYAYVIFLNLFTKPYLFLWQELFTQMKPLKLMMRG
jgi:hypothetical protein